jgi:ribonuclease R
MKMVRKNIKGFKKQGTLFVHPDGYGFVSTDMPKDVFIPPKFLNGAIHNDTVMISVSSRDGKLYEGKVLKIVQRNMKYIVGTVEREHGQLYCSPLDKHITFVLPFEKGTRGLNDGEVVQCELINDEKGNRKARLFQRLGDDNTPEIDLKLVIAKHNLPSLFSRNASQHAASLKYSLSNAERSARHDLTNMPIVTIDGDDAKDFDDAVFVKKTANGYILYVSIADVSHYVKMDDPVDIDAFERGTSVYFPGKVLPMLPEELSNDLCSLKPHEDRLTLTAEIGYDRNGKRLNYRIYPSIIRSSARLTYTLVRDILEQKNKSTFIKGDLSDNLQVMRDLALMLREQRLKNGSLDLDLPDIELTLDKYGVPESITRKERNIAHILIEEFMLEANRVVATYGTSDSHPFIYRIHEQPDHDKLYEFYLFVHNLGLKIPAFEKFDSISLQHVLDKVKDTKLEKVINYTLLRSMKQAKYAVENTGHYGLAFDLYTHFTSPIRRYPDLTVHRMLRDLFTHTMSKKRSQMWTVKLEEIAKHSSETERNSMDAERDLYKILTAKMLMEKQNIPLQGYISGITGSGLFVEIEDFFIDGFLAFEDIPHDYFYSDTARHIAIGKKTGRTFKIGQKLTIQITNIERFTGKIKLETVKK